MSPNTSSFVECESGHFFDAAKNARCPFCGRPAAVPAAIEFALPMGWLVITDGPLAGQDFTIRPGANEIGRSADHAISLAFDLSVAERKHAILFCEAGGGSFSVELKNGAETSTVNGLPLLAPVTLKAGDRLRFGMTSLVFIPLISERFKW